MKKLIKLFLLLLLTSVFACEFESGNTGSTDTPAKEQPAPEAKPERPTTPPKAKTKPDCTISGTFETENIFWAKNENLLVVIKGDKETEDSDFGPSQRILELYDGTNCERIMREILPVNLSPDYPYYLSDITYNNLSNVIAIRGFDQIYILDLKNKKLSKPLSPKYLNERFADDAQSGMIQRLEVWENYLIGYATSMGPFVFDLKDPLNGKSVLPGAEYELEEGTLYNSLFFLPSENGGTKYQAILPKFDMETGNFDINPLFEKPINIQTNINRRFRNNRYLVLKERLSETTSRPIAIDMKAMKKIDLPNDIAKKKDTDIIAWMKKQ
ncbi:MAG TPA: hypothetical protein ENJ95_08460 [Bacteroidetes bacterium]|nr:hypothetical protein [Bacteroidota bacterium]